VNFDDVRVLIEADDRGRLRDALMDLDPLRRKELGAELVTYERQHRTGDNRWRYGNTLAIAGAGLLPNASTLAPFLVRNNIWTRWDATGDPAELVIELLQHRELPWLPDLAVRLAARMRPTTARQDLYRVIVACCGEDPPDADGFILHLMGRGPAEFGPGYDVLIPRMLEVVGAGAALAWERNEWPAFLRGRADRAVLLDGCLARLQQGGAAGEMTGFIALHEAIRPTMDETAAHARDYVAMLPDSRSTVATLAQEQLKWLDDEKRLDFDLLCDASRWVFGRTEKKLVRAQLTWLGKHAAKHPDEVVLVAATLFAHDSADLRARAVTLVDKHVQKIGDATKAELLALAEQLPADLAAQLGSVTTAEEAVALAPFTPRPWPEPIGTLDELTVEVLSLFGRNSGHIEAATAERIIEALVRFAWQDREAVAAALQPAFDKYSWLSNRRSTQLYDRNHVKHDPRSEFIQIIFAAAEPPRPLGPLEHAVAFARAWRIQLKRSRAGGVAELLTLRLHEIAEGLVHSPRPALVSTPTELSGLIDPATLVERLAKAEADEWEPWSRDLKLAFHRLPHDVDASIFASLPGKAGRQLREWIATRADPEVVVAERTYTYVAYNHWERRDTVARLLATVTPGLAEPEKHWRGYEEWGPMIEWWPTVLPAQRDVIAAHLVPHLAHRLDYRGSDGPLLPMLAEGDGPVGTGMHLALAYGLGAELTVNRAYAVDALITLAARDQLDGKAFGEIVGVLLERGDLVLSRVVPGLRDAARSGAARQVWELLATALPRLWTHNRVADIVEFAVELAQQLKPGGEIPGLAEVAERKGSSRTVKEAKRLVSSLSV
jgi:hypothetical protein